MNARSIWVLALLAGLGQGAAAQDWSRFRGPGGTGVLTEARLPAVFTAEHVAWRVPVEGTGHSSPVLLGDRVILTRDGAEPGARHVVAFAAEDGEELWSYEDEFVPEPQHKLNSHAAATPAVDDSGVYLTWTSRGQVTALALDAEGKRRWSRKIGPYAAQHGGGNSPVLWGDLLVVANEHEGEGSSLLALDKATGEPRWTIARETMERRASYASPIVWAPDGATPLLLFTSTAHGLTAVDPTAGEVAWELDLEFGQRFVGVPAIAGDRLILSAGSGGGGKEGAVVKLPTGPDDAPVVDYRPRRNLPYVPGHIAVGERFYLFSDGGIASCLHADTGDVLWSERLDGTFFSSPVSNGEVIWIASREGRLFSLAPGEEFRILGSFDLGSPVQATPAIARDRMYVRTADHLICLTPR